MQIFLLPGICLLLAVPVEATARVMETAGVRSYLRWPLMLAIPGFIVFAGLFSSELPITAEKKAQEQEFYKIKSALLSLRPKVDYEDYIACNLMRPTWIESPRVATIGGSRFTSSSGNEYTLEKQKRRGNISSMSHIDRSKILRILHGAVERSGVVAILGPRQCGKTTLARDFCKSRSDVVFLDLENPGDAARLAEPLFYLERQSGLVVLDEVQLMPQLLPVLRVLADRRPTPAKFLLLGSASPDLVRGASESLAGRVEFLEMSGFGLDEVDGAQDALWWRGGFPRSFLARNDEDARVWLQDFTATFLERDLRKFGIGIPPAALRRLWTVCAHYHGQIWNSSSVAGGLGESSRTVKSHLDILTGTFMLRQLQPWQENLMKRQVKAPKVYLRDTGILHSLLDVPSMDALFAHPKFGASWEGFAIEQICGVAARSQAFYWATHAGAELDLLLFHNGKRLGFECKVADAPRSTKSMHVAIADLRLDHLYVITPREAEFPLSENITASGLQGCLRKLLP